MQLRLALCLALIFAAVACGDDSATTDGFSNFDGRTGGADGAIADGSGGGDGDVGDGTPTDSAGGGGDASLADGGSCATACDCPEGLGCFGGSCISGIRPVYCCSGATCPDGELCQATTGDYSMCGGTGFDGGFDFCGFISCNGAMGMTRCIEAGCTSCVSTADGMRCSM